MDDWCRDEDDLVLLEQRPTIKIGAMLASVAGITALVKLAQGLAE